MIVNLTILTINGLVEAHARYKKAFDPHDGHMLSFGRVMLGDTEDRKDLTYVGWRCETYRTQVDLTMIPTGIADAIDEIKHGSLR